MRVALCSDCHGNLAALEAVLVELHRLGPFDRRVCAGDLALFGPSPAEVVDRLRAAGFAFVRGNTDDWLVQAAGLPRDPALAGPAEPPPADPALRQHLAWCLDRLGPERLAWLADLPLELRLAPAPGAELLVVHATPAGCHAPVRHCAPDLPDDEARAVFAPAGAPVVAFGHRHEAFVAVHGGLTRVNVASLSNTLDGRPVATFVIATWHGGHWSFQTHRVAYDPAPELARARERQLPAHPWWQGLRAG